MRLFCSIPQESAAATDSNPPVAPHIEPQRLHRFNNNAPQEQMSQQFQHPQTHFNPPKVVKPHFNRPPLPEKTIPPHPREVPDKNLRKFMRRMKNRNREAPDLPEYINQTEWQADFAKL